MRGEAIYRRTRELPGAGVGISGRVTPKQGETSQIALARLFVLLCDHIPAAHRARSLVVEYESEKGGRRSDSTRIDAELRCDPRRGR